MKVLREKHTLLIWMMCMAVKECKLEVETLNYEECYIEFFDPVTNIQCSISLHENNTFFNLFIMDETFMSPSRHTMKKFEIEYMNYKSSFFIDGGNECNYLLYFYDNIPITDSASIMAFQTIIMKAMLNAIRFRRILDETDEDED